MASLGLRAFSGISVGLLGSLIGVHWSLALSALATLAVAAALSRCLEGRPTPQCATVSSQTAF